MKKYIFIAAALLVLSSYAEVQTGESVSLTSFPAGNVIFPDEPIEFTLKITGAPNTKLKIRYRVINPIENKTAKKGQQTVILKDTNEIEKKISVRISEIGYYKIILNVVGGKKKIKLEDVFAIVPKRKKTGFKPDSLFGLHAEFQVDAVPEACEKIGAKSVRLDASTIAVQPRKGKWDWKRIDRKIELAKKHHLLLIPILGYSYQLGEIPPDVLEIRDTLGWKGKWSGAYPIKDLEEWKEYVRKTVERGKSFIKYWEIWNEVDLSFYCGTVDEYTSLLRAAYCEIKKVDPEAKVIYGATCLCPYFAEKVFENKGYHYFDILGVHHYNTPHNLEMLMNRIAYTHAQHLWEKFKTVKPILNTEGSVYNYPDKTGKIIGAIPDPLFKRPGDLIKLYVLHASRGIDKFCWFTPWGIFNFDRKERKLRPKPPLVSYAVMTSILEDSKYRGRLSLENPDIFVYAFEKKGNPILVAWHKFWGKKESLALNLHSPEVEIIDRYGKREKLKIKNETLNIPVDENPFFILGGGRKLLTKAEEEPRQKKYNETVKKIRSAPQEKVETRIWFSCEIPEKVRRYGRWPKKLLIGDPQKSRSYDLKVIINNYLPAEKNGTCRVELPTGWKMEPIEQRFSVKPNSFTKANFTLVVPPATGYYEDLAFTIKGKTDDGLDILPYTTQTEIRPKFDLFVQCEKKGKKYEVKVKALNRDKEAVSGKLTLLVPEGKCKPSKIDTGLIEPLAKKEFVFTVSLPAGREINQSFPAWVFLTDKKGKTIGLTTTGIKGTWRYKVADEASFAKLLDISDWKKTKVPSSGYLPDDPWYKGYVWYRIETYIPEKFKGQNLLLNLGTFKDSGEVYFNGEKIGVCGGMPPDCWYGWGYPAKYIVQKKLVKFGQKNIIAVRAYTEGSGTAIHEGPQEILPLVGFNDK